MAVGRVLPVRGYMTASGKLNLTSYQSRNVSRSAHQLGQIRATDIYAQLTSHAAFTVSRSQGSHALRVSRSQCPSVSVPVSQSPQGLMPKSQMLDSARSQRHRHRGCAGLESREAIIIVLYDLYDFYEMRGLMI